MYIVFKGTSAENEIKFLSPISSILIGISFFLSENYKERKVFMLQQMILVPDAISVSGKTFSVQGLVGHN